MSNQGRVETPLPNEIQQEPRFGSDVIAQTIRDLGIDYIALNPGSSFRGLHDSLVNYLGNEKPQLLLCLHEEHAVAIAHGYAKVTGKAMGAAVHSNVGLMHATMAIYNAWCDRMPVMVIGATGPVDAVKRRPWIDWIHTSLDQGALVRNYVKWDAQPASVTAAHEAFIRGSWLANATPKGPIYINLDTQVQETSWEGGTLTLDTLRGTNPVQTGLSLQNITQIEDILTSAKSAVYLAGRVSRSTKGWKQRIQFVEKFNLKVITDPKVGCAFPTDHPNFLGELRGQRAAKTKQILSKADVIIASDWVDLAGALTDAHEDAIIIRVGLDHFSHNGWSMDHQAHMNADLNFACDVDAFETSFIASNEHEPSYIPIIRTNSSPQSDGDMLKVTDIAAHLRNATKDIPVSFAHLPLSWDGTDWDFTHPLDFLGSDGGGGIGSGPALSIGSALALRDMKANHLPVSICGDGDFIMGATAIWTAVHYQIPLLIIVANNRSFYNDEVHQEAVAKHRGRNTANKWIGMRMSDPEISVTQLAQAQGATTFGPVANSAELDEALKAGIKAAREGKTVVIEVITDAGYPSSLVSALISKP